MARRQSLVCFSHVLRMRSPSDPGAPAWAQWPPSPHHLSCGHCAFQAFPCHGGASAPPALCCLPSATLDLRAWFRTVLPARVLHSSLPPIVAPSSMLASIRKFFLACWWLELSPGFGEPHFESPFSKTWDNLLRFLLLHSYSPIMVTIFIYEHPFPAPPPQVELLCDFPFLGGPRLTQSGMAANLTKRPPESRGLVANTQHTKRYSCQNINLD